jgi:hypothetical protein
MKAYHFHNGHTLRDGRPLPPIGKWLEHEGPLVPCESGLHASEHPFDALTYAPGANLDMVELDGEIIPHGQPTDKFCARRRKRLRSIDATELLRAFARRVALDVLPLWHDAPVVVRKYLETGDETIRASAWDAARDAAWAAARDAARDAAFAKYRQWFKEMVEEAMKDAA